MSYKLNHSRHISYGTKEAADREYWRLKQTPTAKQKAFFVRLVMMCKANGIDAGTGFSMQSRADYAMGIDALKKRLIAAGAIAEKPEKDVKYVVTHGSNSAGNYYTHETIRMEDNGDER